MYLAFLVFSVKVYFCTLKLLYYLLTNLNTVASLWKIASLSMWLDFIPGNFFTQEQILSNINVAISTMCFARKASYISLCSSNFFSLFNAIFKGYFPFTVITKYWLYLPFWAIHPQACFTPHSWCFLLSHPILPSNSPLLWKPPFCSLRLWICFFVVHF